jgi:hypothetical protein
MYVLKLVTELTLSLYLNTSEHIGVLSLLKALVISPNNKTVDVGCFLAIARAEACRREQVVVNPTVRALVFVAELDVYVAVYEVLVNPEKGLSEKSAEK